MIEILIGLGGVLIGVLLTWVFALWRTVFEGQTAARVLRAEILENSVKIDMVLARKQGDLALCDEGWKANRLRVAPLLSEIAWFELSRDMGFIGQAQNWIDIYSGGKAEARARQELEACQKDLDLRRKVLGDLEYSNRFRLVWRLVKRNRQVEESAVRSKLQSEGFSGNLNVDEENDTKTERAALETPPRETPADETR